MTVNQGGVDVLDCGCELALVLDLALVLELALILDLSWGLSCNEFSESSIVLKIKNNFFLLLCLDAKE